jgi:hypothetical protein
MGVIIRQHIENKNQDEEGGAPLEGRQKEITEKSPMP